MSVRPPSNDIDDESDPGEFGIVAVDAHVDEMDVSFPIERREFTAKYGDIRVPVDPGGHEITLGDALEQCGQSSFESKQDLLNALHPVFEKKRQSSSILGRLRSLVPF